MSERLASEWHTVPAGFDEAAASFAKMVAELPDQTATVDAQTFLVTAQIRLADFRQTMRANKAADIAVAAATCAYTTYCEVMDAELESLYDDVQQDFSTFYRLINADDEGEFTAKLSPSAGKLDFDVNFYERGLYPPGAFHGEGNQDSMGVCLYLALMKRLFGNQFTFALLDDVAMSVDTGHRHQFCKLLKTHFKDTQFVITTRDRTWAEQMKSAGLVTDKTSLRFHSWTIRTKESKGKCLLVFAEHVQREVAPSVDGSISSRFDLDTDDQKWRSECRPCNPATVAAAKVSLPSSAVST